MPNNGNPHDIKNYYSISLLSTFSKLYERIRYFKINKFISILSKKKTETHRGFVKGNRALSKSSFKRKYPNIVKCFGNYCRNTQRVCPGDFTLHNIFFWSDLRNSQSYYSPVNLCWQYKCADKNYVRKSTKQVTYRLCMTTSLKDVQK